MSTKSFFFRDQYAKTHGRDQATATNIAAEYGKVRMAKGRERVSKSFVDTALTIHARLLQIPEAERLLLEMDSTLSKDESPFQFSPSPASQCVEVREL